MKSINKILQISYLCVLSFMVGSCDNKIEYDPCIETKWLNPEEYEIKLAVEVSENNPSLPGGAPGSQYPTDFKQMQVSGTIEKVECDGSSTGPVDIGNTYIDKGVDFPAPLDEDDAYWIGHVVYVFEFDNDEDHIKINLAVRITMEDGQSYSCNVPAKIYNDEIFRMPGELYYYILIDIYSGNWTKV